MKFKLCSISAYDSTFVACSEYLCGTSNCVFSDLAIGTYFRISNGKPEAHFEIMEKLYGKVLFKTDNYQELINWIENHSEEIQKQIDTKKEEWIKNYKKLLLGENFNKQNKQLKKFILNRQFYAHSAWIRARGNQTSSMCK